MKGDYVLPDNTPQQGMFKARIRPINQFNGKFDSTDINQEEYMLMKEDPCLRKLLQNLSSDFAKDVAIIPPFITKSLVNMIE